MKHVSPVRGRPLRLLALAAAAAGLLAVAPATAPAASRGATMFVLSAESGELQGGSLTLRGVGRRVTWATHAGHSGVVSAGRLHRRLFLRGLPPATGTLRVARQRPGDEPTFRLSRARYDASRQRVRYRVKRLNKRSGRRRVAGASQSPARRPFGPATLSIVHAPSAVGGSSWGGKVCATEVGSNTTIYGLQALDSRKWDTDTWNPDITPGRISTVWTWESDGGFLRGCSNSAVFQLAPNPDDPRPPPFVTIAFTTTWSWSGRLGYDCDSSDPRFYCEQVPSQDAVVWRIRDRGP